MYTRDVASCPRLPPDPLARVPGGGRGCGRLIPQHCSLALASGIISAARLNGHKDRRIMKGQDCNDFSHEFVPNFVRTDGYLYE